MIGERSMGGWQGGLGNQDEFFVAFNSVNCSVLWVYRVVSMTRVILWEDGREGSQARVKRRRLNIRISYSYLLV